MRNRSLFQPHVNQAFLRALNTLAYRLRNFIGFAQTKADQSILIPRYNKGAEAEPPAALNNFGHTVDMNHLFFDIQSLRVDSLCHEYLPIDGCWEGSAATRNWPLLPMRR